MKNSLRYWKNGKTLILYGSPDRSIFVRCKKNNDASIAKNIFINNEQDVLNWLNDNDVVVVDHGFRDAVNTMKRFGFNVEMPDFLKGKKQLSCKEANRSRCVAKVRWIIESGTFIYELLSIIMIHLSFTITS